MCLLFAHLTYKGKLFQKISLAYNLVKKFGSIICRNGHSHKAKLNLSER